MREAGAAALSLLLVLKAFLLPLHLPFPSLVLLPLLMLGPRPLCPKPRLPLASHLMDALLPGFIPRAQHFFTKTYSETCKDARSSFAQQRLGSAHEEQEQRTRLLCQDRDMRWAGPHVHHVVGPGLSPVGRGTWGWLLWGACQQEVENDFSWWQECCTACCSGGLLGLGSGQYCPRQYPHPKYPHQDPPEPGNHQGHPGTAAVAATAPCTLPPTPWRMMIPKNISSQVRLG